MRDMVNIPLMMKGDIYFTRISYVYQHLRQNTMQSQYLKDKKNCVGDEKAGEGVELTKAGKFPSGGSSMQSRF